MTVSGPRVEVYTSPRWGKVAAHTSLALKVLPAEARLACSVAKRQRELLSDMGLNIWQVDPPFCLERVSSLKDKSKNCATMSLPHKCILLTSDEFQVHPHLSFAPKTQKQPAANSNEHLRSEI